MEANRYPPDSHGNVSTSIMSRYGGADSKEYLSRTAKESIKMAQSGAKQEGKERYKGGLIELMKSERPMRMRSKDSSYRQTQLSDVSAGSSVSVGF
jgi:hypothetical protein